MTLYQAALLAEPRNFLAANELGVLLAENGSLSRARELLEHSARLWPQALTWQNLAVICDRLGETRQAELARAKAVSLKESGQTGVQSPVRWVDGETFARMAPVGDTLLPPANQSAPAAGAMAAPSAGRPADETATKKGAADWLPWNSRR